MAEVSQKNKTLRAVLTALSVAAVLAGLLFVTSMVTMPKNNDYESGEIRPRGGAFVAEPENTLDVLFVGDSEVFSSFRPNLMYREHGFTSYCCSEPAQRLYVSRDFVRRALETQHPKLVVLESDSFFFYFNTAEAFAFEVGQRIPVFRNHNRWKSLTTADFTTEPSHDWVNPHKGYRPQGGIVPAKNYKGYMDVPKELETIPPINEYYLNSIVDLCRENGATPIVISTPSSVNWNMGRHDFVEDWAEEKGVEYYDMNLDPHKVKIDWKKDTRDAGDHLNNLGATKLSTYTGKLFDQIYDLPDHRGDPAYAEWDKYNSRG